MLYILLFYILIWGLYISMWPSIATYTCWWLWQFHFYEFRKRPKKTNNWDLIETRINGSVQMSSSLLWPTSISVRSFLRKRRLIGKRQSLPPPARPPAPAMYSFTFMFSTSISVSAFLLPLLLLVFLVPFHSCQAHDRGMYSSIIAHRGKVSRGGGREKGMGRGVSPMGRWERVSEWNNRFNIFVVTFIFLIEDFSWLLFFSGWINRSNRPSTPPPSSSPSPSPHYLPTPPPFSTQPPIDASMWWQRVWEKTW